MAEGFSGDLNRMSEELNVSPAVTSGAIYCDPCCDEDRKVNVSGFCVECNDYLCSECIHIHKKARPSKAHTLKDKTSMPKNRPVIKKQDMCNVHKDEPLCWVCQTHDSVICNLCRVADHRKCGEVKTLAEVSKHIKSSGKLSEVNYRLRKLERDFETKLSSILTNKEIISGMYTRNVNYIMAFISNIQKHDLNIIGDLQITCETSLSTVRSLIDGLNSKEEDACSLEQLFLKAKKAESHFKTFDQRLAQIHGDNVVPRYRLFVEGDAANKNGLIGQLCNHSYKLTALKIDEVNVKIASDSYNCWISGMDLMGENRLAVADNANSKIKLIDLLGKTVILETQLAIAPLDLTNIDSKMIAYSRYSYEKGVAVMSLTDTFQHEHRIYKKGYDHTHGVTKDNGNLWITLSSPDEIYLVDINGAHQRRIDKKDSTGNIRFESPYKIAVIENSDEMYLSENGNNKVIRMTKQGKVLSAFTHKDLVSPRGISVGRDGRVFVCSWDTDMVFELDFDLSHGQTILGPDDGVSAPYSIVYDDVKSLLYVGSSRGGASCSHVQVFQV